MSEERFDGRRIYLRPLLEEDINENYLSWFRDKEVTRFLEAKNLTREDVLSHLKYGLETGTHFMYAICDINSHEHIGNVKVGPIDRKHMTSGLPTFVGNRSYLGKKIGTEAIELGTRIAFEKYGVRKMVGGMYSTNIPSLKAYTAAGWDLEAILKGHYLLDGVTLDRFCIACFNPAVFSADYVKQVFSGNLLKQVLEQKQ